MVRVLELEGSQLKARRCCAVRNLIAHILYCVGRRIAKLWSECRLAHMSLQVFCFQQFGVDSGPAKIVSGRHEPTSPDGGGGGASTRRTSGGPPGLDAVPRDRAREHEHAERGEGQPRGVVAQGLVQFQRDQAVDQLHVDPVDEERAAAEVLDRAPARTPRATPRVRDAHDRRQTVPRAAGRTPGSCPRSLNVRKGSAGRTRRTPRQRPPQPAANSRALRRAHPSAARARHRAACRQAAGEHEPRPRKEAEVRQP